MEHLCIFNCQDSFDALLILFVEFLVLIGGVEFDVGWGISMVGSLCDFAMILARDVWGILFGLLVLNICF
jgi:hypothetical protein